MPAPLPIEQRRQIVERHQAGETLVSISEELHIAYNTVKKVWAHWRKHDKLTPNYEQAKQRGTRKHKPIYEAAIEMKRNHPKWGGVLIRLKLQAHFPDEELPSERTFQRWFRSAGVAQSPKVQQCRSTYVQRGRQVHQVWAVDAKEQMKLVDGSDASWLVVTDEASGAILCAKAFPPQTLVKS